MEENATISNIRIERRNLRRATSSQINIVVGDMFFIVIFFFL